MKRSLLRPPCCLMLTFATLLSPALAHGVVNAQGREITLALRDSLSDGSRDGFEIWATGGVAPEAIVVLAGSKARPEEVVGAIAAARAMLTSVAKTDRRGRARLTRFPPADRVTAEALRFAEGELRSLQARKVAGSEARRTVLPPQRLLRP